MPVMPAFLLRVCSFQIYSGLMKWDVISKTALKGFEVAFFQIVVSLLYVHYPKSFFSAYKQYCHAIPSALMQENFESTNMDFTHS